MSKVQRTEPLAVACPYCHTPPTPRTVPTILGGRIGMTMTEPTTTKPRSAWLYVAAIAAALALMLGANAYNHQQQQHNVDHNVEIIGG
jgi:uncharacterized protein HemX